ncbi:hypothetical protein [Myxacorys almedinensis]|uniref:TonB C-terminal domain-containing protein n=1 Tax=Myxacorys almedinensis A TaxID=2690445 RepID=A0A8J8CLG9_9CYAN|nr:hypothetical protein [Myxacorys almedinensis]NDJ17750.1 hypothetical protein [Myxacorys almedinensis A]
MSSALSAFFRNLPENIQQPASIAFLGSIAAHAFFFASLPAFTSSQENQSDPLRRVGVVDLSPEEQSRLPRLGSSVVLPPLQQSPNAALPLPPPSDTVPVPNNPLLYNIPGLSTPVFPDVQSQPSNNELLKKYLAEQDIAIARRRQQLRNLTPERSQQSATPEPSQTTDPQSEAIASAINRAGNGQIPTLDPLDPNLTFGLPGQPSQPQQSPSPAPEGEPTTPPPPGGETAASPAPEATLPVTPSPTPTQTLSPEVLAEIRQRREVYAYNQADTDADPRFANSGVKAPDQNWVTWKTENIQPALDRGELELVEHPTKEEELETGIPALPYPFPFAIPRFQQNTIVIAATVGTDGKLVGEPVLLGKSGYAALDKEAIAHVTQEVSKYPAPEKPTVHRFVFKYAAPSGQAVS